MSSVEMDVAPAIHKHRVELAGLNAGLEALNRQYPGERKKPAAERDPMFEAQRSPLLESRWQLQGRQYQMRRQLKP